MLWSFWTAATGAASVSRCDDCGDESDDLQRLSKSCCVVCCIRAPSIPLPAHEPLYSGLSPQVQPLVIELLVFLEQVQPLVIELLVLLEQVLPSGAGQKHPCVELTWV